MRLTIACPASHTENANQLAMVLGYSIADGETYRTPSWQDAEGNLYSCASLPIGPNFITAATSHLVRPEWDTDEVIDMTAATLAQALVVVAETPQAAIPDNILAVVGDNAVEVITAMGLQQIEVDL